MREETVMMQQQKNEIESVRSSYVFSIQPLCTRILDMYVTLNIVLS